MIRDDIRIMWLCSMSAMNGSARSSVMKIEMTAAKIGRSMKKCERFIVLPPGRF